MNNATILRFVQHFLCVALFLAPSTSAFADTINPGDLVVGNILAPGGPSNILVVDPATGSQRVLSSAVSFPTGVAFGPSGRLFITDVNARAIVQLNPDTGAVTTVSSGGNLVSPLGLAIGSNGDFFVLNGGNAFGAPTAVVRVNPQTGAQSVVSSGALLTDPTRLTLEANGDILVTNGRFTGSSGVLRIDPVTGAQSVVTSGGNFFAPTGITVDGNGNILVTELLFASGLVRVDPATGAQTIVSSRGLLIGSGGIAVAPSGDLLVVVQGGGPETAGVVRVDPVTGAQSAVSTGGNFAIPVDLAIAPVPTHCEPAITHASVNDPVLWPPNHEMVEEKVSYNVAGDCDPAPRCVLAVASNEPVDGVGGGDTAPDWTVLDATHVLLRAERAAGGGGRIYTITITCTDLSGATASAAVTVTVPHDLGQ